MFAGSFCLVHFCIPSTPVTMDTDTGQRRVTRSLTAWAAAVAIPGGLVNIIDLPTEIRYTILEMAVAATPLCPLRRTTYARLVRRYGLRDSLNDRNKAMVDQVDEDVKNGLFSPSVLALSRWEKKNLEPFACLQSVCKQVYLDLKALNSHPYFLDYAYMTLYDMESYASLPHGDLILQLYTDDGQELGSSGGARNYQTIQTFRSSGVEPGEGTPALRDQALALSEPEGGSPVLAEHVRKSEYLKHFSLGLMSLNLRWREVIFLLGSYFRHTNKQFIILADVQINHVKTWPPSPPYDPQWGDMEGADFLRYIEVFYFLRGMNRRTVSVLGDQPQVDLVHAPRSMESLRDTSLTPRLRKAIGKTIARTKCTAWWMEARSETRKAGCCRGEGCCF